MNEIYIANAHIYFKGNAADAETLYRQLQEICFQNDIELSLFLYVHGTTPFKKHLCSV